jgi:N-acetylmuramic acid 6-phosphate etherase
MLKTEAPSDRHPELDRYDPAQLVDAFVSDQAHALSAVRAARERIAEAVHRAAPLLAAGGRLLYVGAGTSGRLGVLDSVELLPTFSWPNERARALIAGGERAMFEAIEGAEDSAAQGAADLRGAGAGARDVVILIAASGTTPYVLGALGAARDAGALTIGIANNPGAPLARDAHVGIVLDTGAEVISGSTRLKAGTAQKIALNTLSSAIMVRLNKVYGNLMVDLRATNQKLLDRSVRIVMAACGVDRAAAESALGACGGSVKTAIVARLRGIGAEAARDLLARNQGSVRAALEAR